AVIEAERRADRENPLAGPELRRIAEAHDGKPRRRDLEDGDVGTLIRSHHFRPEFPLVDESHRHLARAGHHVSIGEDVPVRTDNEARARAMHRLLVTRLPTAGRRNTEALEEVIERIVARPPPPSG